MGIGTVLSRLWSEGARAQDPEGWWSWLPVIHKVYEPTPSPTVTPTPDPPNIGARVVHIYNANATSWDYASGYFFNHINQAEVDRMFDSGLNELTGASTVADAWRVLLSAVADYAPGKGIAIKVNFNNCWDNGCNDTINELDAVIEPVNAVIQGLKLTGVQESDIWVFDASRIVPNRFLNGCDYPDVGFFNRRGARCATPVTWTSTDPSTRIAYSGGGLADDRVPDLLVDATYLINMPILKAHGGAGITLGFKNHLGSITDPWSLHDHLYLSDVTDLPNWSPLVDIYKNPNIRDKTVLTIGDGLFGSWQNNTGSLPKWSTFKSNLGTDAPNSLFFAVDPVAVDSVMSDFIKVENPSRVENWAVNHLRLAEENGLGVFEQSDPWGSGYIKIDYMRMIL
jgi:hypothetical protein